MATTARALRDHAGDATQAPGSSPDGKPQALRPRSIATGHEHAPARGFVVQTRLHMYEGDKMGFDT